MKIRTTFFLFFCTSLLLPNHSAEAQRRGTGVSTLPPQATETDRPTTQELIEQADTSMTDNVDEMDGGATEEQAADLNAEGEAVTRERDELAADAVAGPQSPNVPAPTESGIDDLSADLPPLEDELPSIPTDEMLDPSTLISDDSYAVPDFPTDEPADFPSEDYPVDFAPPPPVVRENEFEKERKLKQRYQQVKLQALKDQAIRGMRDRADVARTDEDKRAALREYYRMLFAKIVTIDPELQDQTDVLEQAYLRRLGQYRVEPTIPLNPPPTPVPLGSL